MSGLGARLVDRALERDLIPERALRLGIRASLRRRLRTERRLGPRAKDAFLAELRASPIALQPAAANEQHYEEPAEFFELVLGSTTQAVLKGSQRPVVVIPSRMRKPKRSRVRLVAAGVED